jgi:hypothetical protein
VAAAVVTVLSVLSVPWITRSFGKSLVSLANPHLPESQNALGITGLLLVLFGVVDFAMDISLCLTLLSCEMWLLLCCSSVTLLTTTAVTWHLGFLALRKITQKHKPAKDWIVRHPILAPMVVLASSSRLNSMAVLRLRICGWTCLDFPDSVDHRFFHFLRHAGIYHYWLEDVPVSCPHLTISPMIT